VSLAFVPIPITQQAVYDCAAFWLPFLEGISRRSKEPIADLVNAVWECRVQIAFVWDGEKPRALIGIQYKKSGDELIAEIIWLTGKGMREWQHLLPEMKRYLREHHGCTIIRPICRPGWSRELKKRGFKTTHYIMELAL